MLVEVNFEDLVEVLDAKRGVSHGLSIVFYPWELAFGGSDKAVHILLQKREIISHMYAHQGEKKGRRRLETNEKDKGNKPFDYSELNK